MSVRFAQPFATASVYKASKSAPSLRLDVAGNEGRGPSAELLAESVAGWSATVRRYPSTRDLTDALCALRGVDPSQLLVTNGGDEAIDRACRVSLEAGRNAVIPSPTFEMIPRYVAATGAALREVDADPAGVADAIIAAADADTTFTSIVSPNNPSGIVTPAETILRVARALPQAIVLADLAYVEFADVDPTPELLTAPNVVIIRTLSKAWGLAGLRVGYALGHADVIGRMRGAGGPYAVNAVSAAIAARWVREGADTTAAFIERVRHEARALTEALSSRGWETFPTQANFVTLVDDNAPAFAEALLDVGVRVRAWPNDPERKRFARITCPGDDAEFALLLGALDEAALPSPANPAQR